MRVSLAATPFFLATLALAPAAQTAEVGFAIQQVPAAPDVNLDPFGAGFDVFGGALSLSNGDLVGSDGGRIVRKDAFGTVLAVYHEYATPVFPSVLAVDDAESQLVVGESSTGTLLRVDLATGGVVPFATIHFNYDATFDDAGALYLTHGLTSFPGGTNVLRVDTQTGASTIVANVPGPSGPLAFDPAGNLYCGVLDPTLFPGTARVVRFSAAQLGSGALLTEADATLVADGFDNVAYLAYDGLHDQLLLVENDFTAPPSLYAVGQSQSTSRVLARGPAGAAMSNLQVESGSGPAVLAPFQRDDGARARFNMSFFGQAVIGRYEVAAKRARLSVSGQLPGMFGPATVRVDDARPGASMIVWFQDPSLVLADEFAWFGLAEGPLLWALSPGRPVPFFFPVDANGTGTFTFYDPGVLSGTVSFQAMTLDGFGDVEGTTPAANY